MKNKVKKYFVITVALLFAMSAYADWNYKYSNITCVKEMQTLWITALNLEDNSPISSEIMNKNNLYFGDIQKVCDFGNTKFEIKIHYDPPKDHGICGACEPGHLTVTKDNNVILKDIPFNPTRADSPGVMQVIIYAWGKDIYNVKIIAYADDFTNFDDGLVMERSLSDLKKPIDSNYLLQEKQKEYAEEYKLENARQAK